MAKFAYNITKKASTSYIFFELNYRYHIYVFYKKNLNLCLKSKTIKELSFKHGNFIVVCQQNLYYI